MILFNQCCVALFVAFFVLASQSCRYSKPLASFRVQKQIANEDNGYEKTTKGYYYFSFRRFGMIGGYEVVVEKLDGKVTRCFRGKVSPVGMSDGWVRSVSKDVLYDENGKKLQIHKKIVQHQGVGGKQILDTCIYFNDGKKIKK